MKKVIEWAERGMVPDALIRVGIRRLLRHRIRAITPPTSEAAPPSAGAPRAGAAFRSFLRRQPRRQGC